MKTWHCWLCATLKDSTAKSGFMFTLWCNISGELTAVPRGHYHYIDMTALLRGHINLIIASVSSHPAVLVDSSSSLLLSLLLAQLPLFTSAVPAPYRRPNVVHELDRLANQTKNLRQITADLLVSGMLLYSLLMSRWGDCYADLGTVLIVWWWSCHDQLPEAHEKRLAEVVVQ